MSVSPAPSTVRIHTLAQTFQDVFTVVLRTRFNVQRWDRADRMRVAVQQMIAAAAQNARSLGYSDESTEMALYAIIGFLDESVLNSGDPVFADWAGRPLQEERFGTQLAGEYFFRDVADLLNRPDSAEVADVLELHLLCLLLGYRGRYVHGGPAQIDTIARKIREKILRIRGPFTLERTPETPPIPKSTATDRWVRNLLITAASLAVATLVFYLGYLLILSQSMPKLTDLASPVQSLFTGAMGALLI